MKILIQGGGGREFALAENFAEHGHTVTGAPGNEGFVYAGIGDRKPYRNPKQFADVFERGGYDLAVAGGEGPLEAGLGDLMRELGLPFFGPSRYHSRAEWDKAYLHDLLRTTGMMPKGVVFRSRVAARDYLAQHWCDSGYVVKSTALREGKGVYVPNSLDEALAAVDNVMAPPPQGLGDDVLLQERARGTEFSTMTIVGKGEGGLPGRSLNFQSSRDNKPIGPNTLGIDPRMNTGGMGGDSPHPDLDPQAFDNLLYSHTGPMVRLLEDDARIGPLVGLVYNGMMHLYQRPEEGRQSLILESNLGRFGDPEAQYTLSRLRSDLALYLNAAVDGTLGDLPPLDFNPRPSATLVFATPGYPTADYKAHLGKRVRGLDALERNPDVRIFFAGVEKDGPHLKSSGGRVFAVSVLKDTRKDAWEELYGMVDEGRGIGLGSEPDEVFYRRDLLDPEV